MFDCVAVILHCLTRSMNWTGWGRMIDRGARRKGKRGALIKKNRLLDVTEMERKAEAIWTPPETELTKDRSKLPGRRLHTEERIFIKIWRGGKGEERKQGWTETEGDKMDSSWKGWKYRRRQRDSPMAFHSFLSLSCAPSSHFPPFFSQ